MTPDTPPQPVREISDAQTLRALAHPVRLALLDTLGLEGPLTATEAGERIGESPTTCSFHLRQLAKYGFVEEAGGGTGRARPWRMTPTAMRFSSDHEDSAADLAATTLARMYRERHLARLQQWNETKGSYPKPWRDAGMSFEGVSWLTPDELSEINEELVDLLMRRVPERRTDPSTRPEGALPVEHLIFAYPINPTSGGDQS